jgi:hypothetical protein
MAVIKKTLFPKNLDKYAVLVNDIQSDSKYFKITELFDTFTGGKNAFLIAGSGFLVPDTKIQIELKDSAGNIIYHEPGEGFISSSIDGNPFITEYYEGVSKVVAVYIYPETAYGPCTLTILGELSEYEDGNGILTPVPLDWENKYNIKWQRQIDVNPSLSNTTKIRFYKRPTASIKEILSPIYRIESGSKVDSGISQSFADIKLSNLETFAGDVKRVKVFRTSEGDISDYDLIQDILVESKELLTSYGLSGSVVGETGILTSETLKNNWKTGSLNAYLTSSRVESGVRLTGSGYFTYSSSLDIKNTNTYELNLDAFYSSPTSSNLGIYLSYVSQSTTFTSSIATLVGTEPTKNLLDTVIPFRIDRDYPSASLYFSQSQGEWHLGNISLKLSEDTAFSPDEVSFITTMPSIIGNETFNFKFEFYDVNNNYVPVEVTQSATFTGGANLNNTIIFISASASSSLAQLNAVSSSISGTMTVYSSSASGSIGIVSSSVSALSSSISSSNSFILSSSLSKVQQLANGQFSGSFIGDTFIYSPTIGGQQGYISELFKVGTAPSIYLDARQNPRKIFIGGVTDSGSYNNSNTTVYMDSTGKFSLGNKLSFDGSSLSINGSIVATAGSIGGVNIASNKIYVGTGTYAATNTGFYLDNAGQFSLKDKLQWDGTNLTVNGSITVTGGNAATDANAQLYASRAVTSGSVSANAAQTAAELFAASAAGRAVTSGSNAASSAEAAAIAQAKSDASASINLLANGNWTAGSGTFITSRSISSPVLAGNAGYISEIFRVGQNGITLDGGNKKIFVGTGTYNNANTPFYFASGSTDVFSLGNKLTFNGSALSIDGTVNAIAGNFTGNINAATGQIGSWTIDNGNLRNSSNRLILDPTTPSIKLKDSAGSDKTIFRTGPLSGISTTTLYVPGQSVTIPNTIINNNQNYGTGKVYGSSQSLGSLTTANYEKSVTYNPGTSTAITMRETVSAYAVVEIGQDIFNSSGVVVDSIFFAGVTLSKPISSNPESAYWPGEETRNISLNIPAADTYTVRSWYRITIQYLAGSGNVEVYDLSSSTIDVYYDKINNFTEITEQGIQVVSSLSRYVRISTNQFTDVDALFVLGGVSSDVKNFKITHPLDKNKWLFHASIESPRVDNLYRGMVKLVEGFAKINLDEISNMTEGTWVKLNRDPQFFLQNMNGWDRLKGKVIGNELFIYCENKTSEDLISYMVIGERQDDEIKQLQITDNTGRLIPEILK